MSLPEDSRPQRCDIIERLHGFVQFVERGAGIHVERCRVLLHLIDCTVADPIESWRTIRRELAAYDEGLAGKPEILALSKTDSAPADYLDDVKEALQAEGAGDVYYLSSATGNGVPALLRALMATITDSKEAEIKAAMPETEWHPSQR